MHRSLGICFLILIAVAPVLAQTKRIDSLRAMVRHYPGVDTVRVNRLNDLAHAWEASERQQDSAATLALNLARRLHYPHGQARSLYILSLTKAYRQPKVAQERLNQAFQLAQSTGDSVLLTDILRLTGISYLSDGERALPYLQRAVALANTTGQQTLIARSTSDLGMYYAFHSMYPPALRWYLQMLRAAQKAGSTELEIKALQRIAGVYIDLTDYTEALTYLQTILHKVGPDTRADQILALADVGKCYLLTGQYTRAIVALRDGLHLSETYKERPHYHKLPLQATLADAYQHQGYVLAQPYALSVLANAKRQQAAYMVSRVSVVLARYHLHARQPDSAIYYGRQAIAFSLPDQTRLRQLDANQVLAGAYAQRRQFAIAYAYQSRYLAFKDSVNNEEITRKATVVQFNDQMNHQRNQIALLTKDKQLQTEAVHRQRQLLYTTLAVLALIGGFLAVLYRKNRNEQRANALLQRQKTEIQNQRDQTQQALTELKATQVQLVQREKMASLGELTAGIAHEIQNPLNFVNNFSELSTELVEEIAEEQQKSGRIADEETELLTALKSNLQRIRQHGQRASGIVKGMLEHARTTAGDVQTTDLNALCEEYLRLAYQGHRIKDNTFECQLVAHLDPAIEPVEIVPQELGRVLLNLFNNAFYAVRERQNRDISTYQPIVRVNTALINGAVEIRVSDNGVGMSKSVQQKIFQPFFTTRPAGQGTGLGLSLSYDIVTKGHRGKVDVSSQEGQGTEFTIWLPILTKQLA